MAVKITLTNVGVNISNLLDIWVSSGGTGGTFELYQTDISKIELMNGYVISSPPFGVNAYQIKDNNCLQVLTLGCGSAPTTTTTTTAAPTTAAPTTAAPTTAAPTTAAPTTAAPPTTDATTSAGTFTATVSINGYPEYHETLTANVTNSNCTGTLAYQWKRNGANVGSDSSTYLLGINDIGTNISVVVSCSNSTGSVSSSYVSVTRRNQAAPSAPSIQDYTYNSITVYVDSDALYSINNGVSWQASNTFSGLNPETEYCIISYYPDTNVYFASANSLPTCQTTSAQPATETQTTETPTTATPTTATPTTAAPTTAAPTTAAPTTAAPTTAAPTTTTAAPTTAAPTTAAPTTTTAAPTTTTAAPTTTTAAPTTTTAAPTTTTAAPTTTTAAPTTTTAAPTTTTTTTDTHFLYWASNTTYGDSTQTCAANPVFDVGLYGNRDFLYQIETFYTNKSLTIPFNGNGFWYKVSHDLTLYAVQIDEGGGVILMEYC